MATCQHVGADPRESCGHPAIGEAGLCLWHQPTIRKSDSYVAELFIQADIFSHGHFAGAHLAGLRLIDRDLHGRDLRGADLRDAVLDGCNLAGADLSGAVLRRTSLRHANLRGAKLGGTDLSGTALNGADLRETDLSAAIIQGTSFLGADLRGADLGGAQITDFHWNRLTRFAGVRGLAQDADAQGHGSTDDTTQIFPAQPAFGSQDLDTPGRMALDRDVSLECTRTYSPVQIAAPAASAAGGTTVVMALAVPAPHRRAWLVPSLLGALAIGAAWGATTALVKHPHVLIPAGGDSALVGQLNAAGQQHDADLAALTTAQEALTTAQADSVRLRQLSSGAQADAESLRSRLIDLDHDLARLSGADDRAALAELRAQDLETLAGDLARQSSRQDRIARVLADGLARQQEDATAVSGERDSLRARAAKADQAVADADRLRGEMLALRQERDQYQILHQGARDELQQTKADLTRWLTRVEASGLGSALAEDQNGAPLLAVKPGAPIALGSEFLVSLVIDRAPAPGPSQVSVRLVVQRPAAAANPDATVILYDKDRRPLRRLSFGFPHVDAGGPFVSASATLACDRFPTYARVLLAPGDETLATRR